MSDLNPFLAPATLPYGMPPFDAIRAEHYLPAYDEGMRRQREEIAAIANQPAAPSFDNTIAALERSGRLLDRVGRIFGNLRGAHTSDALEAIALELAPRVAAHADEIAMDAALFARIDALHAQRDSLGLTTEQRFLLERIQRDFVRAGAALDEAGKAALKAINVELATLSTTFSQNILKATNAGALVVDTAAELAGMTPAQLAAAKAAAEARGLQGKYLLALQNTSTQPLLAVLEHRPTRERLHQASLTRCLGGEFDNRPLALRMATLRARRAQLLGFASHAAWVTADETSGSVAAVNGLLADLARPALALAKREAAAIQARIDAAGGGFTLAAHDWAFYSEQVRQQQYAFDESALKPYLELERVLRDGVFYAAERLYGIKLVARNDLPLYHPDTQAWEVFDHDGRSLALFITDFYARPSKRGGAWMNAYLSQSRLLGQLPVVGNHLNVPKPPAGEPTLLSWREVTTLFHEFGHALHGMLSDVTYPRLSGTQVPRDFVEYPSQLNEMWADWPEVLQHYARHWQSGEAMPRALMDKLLAANAFNQGFATCEYLAAAVLDQAWHQIDAATVIDDAESFEREALARAGLDLAAIPPRYRSSYFAHIFAGGYSAGYYAYIWSEVLDADSAAWFAEHGGLTRENGARYREQVLSRGGNGDARALFRAFQGRDPQVGALLKRRALDTAEEKEAA